jgi:parallel beta-helix repeat protein
MMLLILEATAQDHEILIKQGDIITRSIKVKRATYHFKGADSLTPALIIEGDNITIDFNNAIVEGDKKLTEPNSFSGVGILVRKGKNIVLKNVRVNGFKVAVMANNVKGLTIMNSDFSYNFRQHLMSDRFREDVSDWQSYHHNEKGEWLRFGAGIYLDHCDNATIQNTVVTNGQCGLMMTHCNKGKVFNNNFSFNSGLGIGMYRSNSNLVLNNKVDWNVRGYSYGYYYRGKDSGGMLVFEQCSDNVFANNSVTHSGDGFFLWAGQQTLDEGTGGCNDNLIYGNDFSFAPTNAIEITFSRNKVIKNKLHGSWHGIWGGFSYNTVIVKNDFGGNLAGISIEHGQDNIIEQNTFTGDSLAIELWATPNRRPDFGFMKNKDTRSINYLLTNNVMTNVPTVYSIKNTQFVTIANNQHSGYRTLQTTDTFTKIIRYESSFPAYDYTADSSYIQTLLPGLKKQDAFLPAAHPQGKKSIMMTEWGPYNFGYPILWWTRTDSSGKMYFDVTGPVGIWKIKSVQGVKILSASSGKVPGTIEVHREPDNKIPVKIELVYNGEKVISPFGKVTSRGQAYTFGYNENSLPMSWDVSWFGFDSTNDPILQPLSFNQLLNSNKALKTETIPASDYRHLHGKGMPESKFATLVNTEVDAPKGTYQLGVTAGEMVRVYIDGKLVIDSWNPSSIIFDADYHKDTKIKLNGKHHIKIVQAQYGTYGMLSCTIKLID